LTYINAAEKDFDILYLNYFIRNIFAFLPSFLQSTEYRLVVVVSSIKVENCRLLAKAVMQLGDFLQGNASRCILTG